MSIPWRISRHVPKVGANRSSCLTASPDIWICEPLNPPPPNAPWGIVGRLVFSLCPLPDESADVNHSWCQSVKPFDSFSRLLNVLPPQRAICLAYIHSQMNLHMCAKFGGNRYSRLTASTDVWICDPLKPTKMPPGILGGEFYLAYVHSQTNLHTCTKFGANRSSPLTASPDFWICDHLKPPGVLRGELYLAYVDSQTNPQICTIFGANRSSRLTPSPNIWICDPLTPPRNATGFWGVTWI